MNIKKQIHKYDPDTGEYVESFSSLTEASETLGIDASHIGKVARGKRNQAGGWAWSYLKEDNFVETDVLSAIAIGQGINPDEVVGGKYSEDNKGNERVSIEVKRKAKFSDTELQVEYVQKKAKQLQRKKDELNVVNKHFREYARIENTLTALNEALIEQLTLDTYKPITYEHPVTKGTVLIVQVTDLHLNELVQMPDNKFDFVVAAQRMQMYADKIRIQAKAYNCTEIVVAFTGDILNSDRRLDEKMHMATNRTKASIIASQILYHFLQDINRVANLSLLSVSGNESRINEDFSLSEIAMSDNYDFLIFNMIKLLFKGAKGITFIEGDPVEQVINVNGSNILLTHGTTIKEGQAAMQQVFGKYAAKGILLDYAIFGHIHFTNVTDIYSRSGSLIGNNVYSDRYLNLITKASQVIHAIALDGTIDNIKVGLQYADAYEGYDIQDDINAYNSKLADNTKERTTIVQIVI